MFWICLDLFGFVWIFLDFFVRFLKFVGLFWIFFVCFNFAFFCFVFYFFFLQFLSKLLRLLLKVTKVLDTKKIPKMGQNRIMSPFLPEGQKKPSAEGLSPPQELEVGSRSGLNLLVIIIINDFSFF